jgi:hypothetical protein
MTKVFKPRGAPVLLRDADAEFSLDGVQKLQPAHRIKPQAVFIERYVKIRGVMNPLITHDLRGNIKDPHRKLA